MSSSSATGVTVAVRVRPLSQQEKSNGVISCVQKVTDNVAAIKKGATCGGYLKSQMGGISEYAFDAVFDEMSSQREVYEVTTKPYLTSLVEGFNVTVFAYGATGAGKTHTMMGNSRSDEASDSAEAGIIPNALVDLFDLIEGKRADATHAEEWSISVSFIEVYNEQVYDLLEPTGRILQVREDQERGIVVVAGVTERVADSADDVLALLMDGNLNRKTEATMANQVSSRSHAVLQVTLKHSRKTFAGKQVNVESKLSLIDLAGSERASATNNRGARLQEGANINKSLLALANCINALASGGKKQNVKYRDSKLTHLLKSSLEGQCNLIMIANINPSHHTYEDSHNTLKYANRAKNIKVNPAVVEVTQESTWMEREETLRRENAFLRARVQALEKELQILKSGRQSLLIESDCDALGNMVYPEGSFRQSFSGLLETIEVMDMDEEQHSLSRESLPISNTDNWEELARVVAEPPPEIICASVDESKCEENSSRAAPRTGEKRSRDVSWDMGLSDSVLAAGLFSTDDTFLNCMSPKVKKTKKLKDEPPSVESEAVPPIAVAAVKQSKKRRDSFIPMPSRRKSIVSQPSAVLAADNDDAVFSENRPVVKPSVVSSRRMSVGGYNRSAPIALIVPAAASVASSSEEKREPMETKTAKSRRTSLAVGAQENVDPQQGQGNIFSKGFKMISQGFKFGSGKTEVQDDCDSKSIAAKKSKPLHSANTNTMNIAVDDTTQPKITRTSNRRKSIAVSNPRTQSTDMWKDI